MTIAEARVLRLAERIAEDAPKKQGQYVWRAGIQWALIHELRAALRDLEVERARLAERSTVPLHLR